MTCLGFHSCVPLRTGSQRFCVLSLTLKSALAVKVCEVPFLSAIWRTLYTWPATGSFGLDEYLLEWRDSANTESGAAYW